MLVLTLARRSGTAARSSPSAAAAVTAAVNGSGLAGWDHALGNWSGKEASRPCARLVGGRWQPSRPLTVGGGGGEGGGGAAGGGASERKANEAERAAEGSHVKFPTVTAATPDKLHAVEKLKEMNVRLREAFSGGDFHAAVHLATELVIETTAVYGQDHPAFASAVSDHALALTQSGDLDLALDSYEKALETYRKLDSQATPAEHKDRKG